MFHRTREDCSKTEGVLGDTRLQPKTRFSLTRGKSLLELELHQLRGDGDAAARTADECDARRDTHAQENGSTITTPAAVLHFAEIRAVGKIRVNMRARLGADCLEQQFHVRASVEVIALVDFDCVHARYRSTTAAGTAGRRDSDWLSRGADSDC
jgi:hypothetical protein